MDSQSESKEAMFDFENSKSLDSEENVQLLPKFQQIDHQLESLSQPSKNSSKNQPFDSNYVNSG
jgi:hypothetical protein